MDSNAGNVGGRGMNIDKIVLVTTVTYRGIMFTAEMIE